MPSFNANSRRPLNTNGFSFRASPPPNPYAPKPVISRAMPRSHLSYPVHARPVTRIAIHPKLGSINLAPGGQTVTPQQGAAQGAAAGSAWGPIGTAVGAAIGTVVGLLSAKPNTAAHIGTWSSQLASSIGAMPASAAGVGRQIPWNENSHGLVQMIEALMAVGAYMAWDPSILSNYDVCAHWAMTFGAAVQTVTTAIVQNPAGKSVTVSISEQPGANHGPINFTFVNPGITVGPDAISAKIIMGSAGLMYAMIIGLGETAAHASSNANNSLAQKIYAYMVDNVAATLAPAATTPSTPVTQTVAPAVQAASSTVNAAVAAAPATANTQPVTTTTDNSAALMAQNAAMLAALQNLETQQPGSAATPVVNVSAPASTTSGGISTTDLLLIGGVALAAILFLKK